MANSDILTDKTFGEEIDKLIDAVKKGGGGGGGGTPLPEDVISNGKFTEEIGELVESIERGTGVNVAEEVKAKLGSEDIRYGNGTAANAINTIGDDLGSLTGTNSTTKLPSIDALGKYMESLQKGNNYSGVIWLNMIDDMPWCANTWGTFRYTLHPHERWLMGIYQTAVGECYSIRMRKNDNDVWIVDLVLPFTGNSLLEYIRGLTHPQDFNTGITLTNSDDSSRLGAALGWLQSNGFQNDIRNTCSVMVRESTTNADHWYRIEFFQKYNDGYMQGIAFNAHDGQTPLYKVTIQPNATGYVVSKFS